MRPVERRLDKLSSELCRLLAGGRCYYCGHSGTVKIWHLHELKELEKSIKDKIKEFNKV